MTTDAFPALSLVPKTDVEMKAKDFKTDQEVRWCPGCGDYAILAAVQRKSGECISRHADSSICSEISRMTSTNSEDLNGRPRTWL